jgi:hypothetical protein
MAVRLRTIARRGALVLAALAVIAPSASAEEAVVTEEATVAQLHPADLKGRWAGMGAVKPTSSAEQKFKCVATYFPGKDGIKLKQNLRCQNEDMKLDVATLMQITDGQITGTWTEKTYALEGTLSGAVTDNRIDVDLKGQFFKAAMTIINTECEQEVLVTPVKADQFEYLSAKLRKC